MGISTGLGRGLLPAVRSRLTDIAPHVTDETREALIAGLGVCLVAQGNTALFAHDQIAVRPVTGIPPAELVLAWRHEDDRPMLRALVKATQAVIRAERRTE